MVRLPRGDPKRGEDLVLVTGGSGFIGSHLVEQLLGLGYTVRVFDNLETGKPGERNKNNRCVPCARQGRDGADGDWRLEVDVALFRFSIFLLEVWKGAVL